jgi:hypothetical protein
MIHVACVATACGESQIATLLSCATTPRPAWMRDQCRGQPTGRKCDIALSTGSAARYRADSRSRYLLSFSHGAGVALVLCSDTLASTAETCSVAASSCLCSRAAKGGAVGGERRNGAQLLAHFAFGRKRWRCCGCDCRTCASIVLGWFVPYAKTHARTSRFRHCSRTAAASAAPWAIGPQ